jgi:hypothetical protein
MLLLFIVTVRGAGICVVNVDVAPEVLAREDATDVGARVARMILHADTLLRANNDIFGVRLGVLRMSNVSAPTADTAGTYHCCCYCRASHASLTDGTLAAYAALRPNVDGACVNVLLTARPMGPVLGIAYVGTACSLDSAYAVLFNTFDGSTLAHELAHSVGNDRQRQHRY